MECLLALGLLVLVILWPLGRMLFSRGPNNWRRLMRLDIAALLVILTGVAIALAIVRGVDPLAAICGLTIILPMSLALAWLGRYVIEDLAGWHTRRKKERTTDFSFLKSDTSAAPDPVMQAEVIDDQRERGRESAGDS